MAMSSSDAGKSKRYAVNEMFYSVQGEGGRAGTANVFIRLAGCNLTCNLAEHGFDCDTEFTSSVPMTAHEIAAHADELRAPHDTVRAPGTAWVILTGGEPTLQLDAQLSHVLHEAGYLIAIETNGTKPLGRGVTADYIACSPKTAEHTIALEHANEVRYVRNVGMGIPRPRLQAPLRYLSPAANSDGTIDRAALAHCIALVKAHPDWMLSVQQHKQWGVR